ncbi:E3 ubiquitin-protein ligase TRAIP [Nylanderia fulva]|uniref:E3 ubiquitin-protein ligase TRAIP n=1 Tax=Nylanderia fulva TaxID=613905 RepID=UPI0010FB809A|nr:E3 ubiquitin-protein ligase TRAIP [Nylanderia fulva]
MNIVCVICSELLVPSDDVFHTPCGHIFHFGCLIQWLERSRTCPQCRERTTENKIHRLYFNFSNSDNIIEDSTSLQHKVDNLTFQLQLKDQNINNLTEVKEKLEKQTAGLRQEVRHVEKEINGKNSAIHALKEQIKYYKLQCQDTNTYKKEAEQLKNKIEHFKNLQALLDPAVEEVDNIIAMTHDIDKLKTYIVAMKKQIRTDFQKRRVLRDKIKVLEQKLITVSTKYQSLSEEHTKRKELEKQLIICESEKITLQNQLLDMQASAHKKISNKISGEKQDRLKIHKDCNPEAKFNGITNEDVVELDVSPIPQKNDSVVIESNSTEVTPQNIKSQGFFSMKDHGFKRERSNSNLKVPSILAKKSKFNAPNQIINGNGMTFDGFGGHAKYDKFPSPISNSHVKKIKEEVKRSKLDSGNNQKLSDLLLI